MAIQVTRPSMPTFEEYCKEIHELWQSRWLTNEGVKLQEFQAELESYLQVPHVALCTNGHLALENVLAALQLPRGGEVITTPFTFASTTHAIVRSGLVPVFCDVDERDYTIDADKLEALIAEKTVAILPVHVYGNLCDVKRLQMIADKHGLKLVYDAAHAFGVTYNGVSVACFGDAAMFSFHATKVFHTIEGGAVCYADAALTPALEQGKNFGLEGEDSPLVGGNAKMSEFQAAMGICNLRHIDEEIQRRRRAAERYTERLFDVKGIKLCRQREGITPNYAYYPVLFDGFCRSRDEVLENLRKNDIYARKYFYPLTNSFSCYRGLPAAGAEKTPVAQHVAEHVLALPLYADLSLDDVDHICDRILDR